MISYWQYIKRAIQVFQKYETLTDFREIRFKLLSRLGKVNLLKVLGSLLTESHVLRGFRKYVTLRVWKEIRMKLLFRFGKANLLEILQNLVTWITIAERISKIYSIYCQSVVFVHLLILWQDNNKTRQDNLNPKTSHAADNYIKDSTRRSWRGFQATHGSISLHFIHS